MRLVRYNPFNELAFFSNSFNNMFNDSFFNSAKKDAWQPAVDILDEKDSVVLSVDLPGIDKDDISVNIEDNLLTISGERKIENEDKKDGYYRKERRYGSFKRAFSLSDDIATDDVNAEFKNGVLKVTLKKDTEKEEVKQITIN